MGTPYPHSRPDLSHAPLEVRPLGWMEVQDAGMNDVERHPQLDRDGRRMTRMNDHCVGQIVDVDQ